MHRIVRPDEIRSVRAASPKPAVSIRVVLPPIVGRMQIFDRDSCALKEEIICATERKTVELAGLIATLGGQEFAKEIDKITASCLLNESRAELMRLRKIAREVYDS